MKHASLRHLAVAAVCASALACSREQPAAPATPAPAAAPAAAATAPAPAARSGAPELGTFGFDVAGMDRSVAPGDDFFAFANGAWVRNTPIPDDRSRYAMFSALAEKALARSREIVEGAAVRQNTVGDERKIADAYIAFMDEAAIEKRGLDGLKPRLDEIAAIDDVVSLSAAIGATLRADVDLLNATDYYTDRPFGVWVTQHLERPTEAVPYLVQGGLGMPDRDFFLEGGRFLELRAKYEAYVAQVLGLAGIADPAARAKRIVALETEIARVHATQLETSDVRKGANAWPRESFAARAPGIDWDALFEAAGLDAQTELIVWQPGAVQGMSALVASQPLQTWKDYLSFHEIDRHAGVLPKAYADASFAFHAQALYGTPKQRDRWKRALEMVDFALGEAVGKLYVERHFSAQTRARADAMVANIVAAFGRRIDALAWMTPETKAQAKKKLGTLTVGMGFPDSFRDYSALEIRREDALGNFQRASLFEYRRNLAKLGRPVTRDEWYLLPQQVNALNVPLENRLLFPAAILQPPFFDANADDAVNYGAIGGVIGHEITHSFDSSGALFDAEGRLANWWTPADLAKFEAAGKALAAQFSAYKPFPDLAVNGELTLAENIADVAGLATAYDAYRLSQEGKPAQVLDGFTPDQRFFLGWAQAWRSKYREPALRNALLTDGHAPGEYRSATVRNLDAWYPAFDVKEGQQRFLAKDQRVAVW